MGVGCTVEVKLVKEGLAPFATRMREVETLEAHIPNKCQKLE